MLARPPAIRGAIRRIAGPHLLALLAALALSGCYTLLRHPSQEITGQGAAEAECARCHVAEESYATDSYPWVEHYSYSSSPWINYYGSRWWSDERWVWCPDCIESGTEGQTATVLRGRHGWDRRLRHVQTTAADSTRVRDPLVVPAPIAAPPTATAPIVGAAPATSSSQPESSAQEEEKPKPPRKRSIRR
jgi:hypothetical protein